MDINKYTKLYFQKKSQLLGSLNIDDFKIFLKEIKKIKKNKKKVILLGNGGSAAMASHVSVDLTKQCGVRAINFNEADLITCFANDYGHDNWMKEAIKKYADRGDIIILISSSGNSKNHIIAGKFCKIKNLKLITFTGFNGKNKLAKIGNLNFIVNSKNFNQIEMVHHIWLLLACDYISNTKI